MLHFEFQGLISSVKVAFKNRNDLVKNDKSPKKITTRNPGKYERSIRRIFPSYGGYTLIWRF
jgi:hypothetical protein